MFPFNQWPRINIHFTLLICNKCANPMTRIYFSSAFTTLASDQIRLTEQHSIARNHTVRDMTIYGDFSFSDII